MINWLKNKFKKKQPLVTCYTTVRGLETIYPPKLATAAIPDWFKKMPKEGSLSDGMYMSQIYI